MRLSLSLCATLTVTLMPFATVMAFEQFPPPGGHSLGSVTGGDFRGANLVIQKNCISCHSSKVIKDAIAAGKDMKKIEARMEQKGVKLSATDKKVLGVFWEQTPLKKR